MLFMSCTRLIDVGLVDNTINDTVHFFTKDWLKCFMVYWYMISIHTLTLMPMPSVKNSHEKKITLMIVTNK